MSGRGRPTFNKRQKEQKRKEKQQEKNSRRDERKLTSAPLPDEDTIAAEALAELAERARLALEEQQELAGLSSIDPDLEFLIPHRD
jgi:Spy/CpxP family protein refolding chaperone